MKRPGLTRSVRDLLRDRREPTYPVEGWTPRTDEPMRPPPPTEGIGRAVRPTEPPPKPADVHARRRTPVVSTSLTDYTDAQLILLADEVGRELRRRRIRSRTGGAG